MDMKQPEIGGQPEVADQRGVLSGVHYLLDSAETVHLRVFAQKPDRWKAQLSGRAFSVAAHRKQLEEAMGQVVTWFRRAFPRHICNPKCQTQAFGRVEEKRVEAKFAFRSHLSTSNRSIPETQTVPSLHPGA